MEIRRYKSVDLRQISRLFYETVHAVNIKDYTKEQINTWATGRIDLKEWDASFQRHITYVVTENDLVVGFGDIDRTGYLDKLFVHKDFQGRGIATAICDRLENEAEVECIRVHASITAKSFFERRGYRVVKRQEVERQGVLFNELYHGKVFGSPVTRSHTNSPRCLPPAICSLCFRRISHCRSAGHPRILQLSV